MGNAYLRETQQHLEQVLSEQNFRFYNHKKFQKFNNDLMFDVCGVLPTASLEVLDVPLEVDPVRRGDQLQPDTGHHRVRGPVTETTQRSQ